MEDTVLVAARDVAGAVEAAATELDPALRGEVAPVQVARADAVAGDDDLALRGARLGDGAVVAEQDEVGAVDGPADRHPLARRLCERVARDHVRLDRPVEVRDGGVR